MILILIHTYTHRFYFCYFFLNFSPLIGHGWFDDIAGFTVPSCYAVFIWYGTFEISRIFVLCCCWRFIVYFWFPYTHRFLYISWGIDSALFVFTQLCQYRRMYSCCIFWYRLLFDAFAFDDMLRKTSPCDVYNRMKKKKKKSWKIGRYKLLICAAPSREIVSPAFVSAFFGLYIYRNGNSISWCIFYFYSTVYHIYYLAVR